jgi:hypothetical protein
MMHTPHIQLTQQLSECFAALPQVEAVALGGSRGAGGAADAASDIDLYVYTRGGIPLEARQQIVAQTGGATQANLDLNYWGPGDEWFNAPTGIEVDIVYFDAAWMEEQITRVVDQHQASMGYTTCFWYTVRQSIVFSDPNGWFAALQQRCQVEYPETLRRNIIALNHPVLRGIIPAYAHQVEKAARRGDAISINHRLAALFASYFDVLFAANRFLHPGEKRMVEYAVKHCAKLPVDMEANITAVLRSSVLDVAMLSAHLTRLLDRLDQFLSEMDS